jgi:hypothetical protein
MTGHQDSLFEGIDWQYLVLKLRSPIGLELLWHFEQFLFQMKAP